MVEIHTFFNTYFSDMDTIKSTAVYIKLYTLLQKQYESIKNNFLVATDKLTGTRTFEATTSVMREYNCTH